MSRNLLPLLVLLSISSTLWAQVPVLPLPVKMFMKKAQPTAKASSQAYRLVAETYLTDEGSGIDFIDSTTYVYNNNSSEAVDSSYTYQWMGSSWEPQRLEVTQYNTQGWPVGLKGYYFAGPDWEQDARGTTTFDGAGNILTMVYEEHDGTSWDTIVKFVNVYQNNLVVEETLYQNQGTGLEPWVKTLYHYNAQGWADTVETQMNFGGWAGMEKVTYTYNAAGKVLTKTTLSGDFMGGWENSSYEVNIYNGRNDIMQRDEQVWNGSSWENNQRSFYQVTAAGLLEGYLVETWTGAAWEETSQVFNFYNGTQLDSVLHQQKWSGTWENDLSTAYGYDTHGNETIAKEYFWNGGAWEHSDESRKYYEAYNTTGIGNQPQKLASLTVYPNPVENVATFSFTAEKEGMAALAVYDLAGRQIFAIGTQATAGNNVLHWDASVLPVGSYIYKLKVDGKVATGVLVK